MSPTCRNHPNITMTVKGDCWECPECNYRISFPKRVPTLPELLKMVADRDKEIIQLRKQVSDLEEYKARFNP